jgi:hypothetical protein
MQENCFRRILKNVGLIFFGCFFYGFFKNFFFINFRLDTSIFSGVLDMLVFGFLVNFFYVLTYELFKSKIFFLICSWALFFYWTYIDIQAATSSNSTLSQFGVRVYLDGKIQPVGMFFRILNPIFFMALFSIFLFFKNNFRLNYYQPKTGKTHD